MSVYIAIKPGTSEVLCNVCSTHYETMREKAGSLGGVVTNADWYKQKFGVDPSAKMDRIGPNGPWKQRPKNLTSINQQMHSARSAHRKSAASITQEMQERRRQIDEMHK